MAEHEVYQNITIESIDQAIVDWFDKSVDAHVVDPAGSRKKVPVGFGAAERWFASRQKKGIRDPNGVLILPLINIGRKGIEPSPQMSALGVETANLQIAKKISGKTNQIKNNNQQKPITQRQAGDPVVYEVTTIPFPDRSIITYQLTIQTQYVVQMNAILEKMFHELDLNKSFVAPLDNHHRHPPIGEDFELRKKLDKPYVVGFFDSELSDSGNMEEFTDQEKIIKYQTTFRVPATLQLDPEGERPAIKVERTSFGLDFGDERVCFVDDPEELELIFGRDYRPTLREVDRKIDPKK